MLYQPDTDVLFPARIIPTLRHLRGPQWANLIDYLCQLEDETHLDILAFSYMMIQITSCITCHADSFRALRGCTNCAQQTISRYKGSDSDLIELWQKTRLEVQNWLETTSADEILGRKNLNQSSPSSLAAQQ
jgi:hypothetical protein